jgi:hypothetical protein
MNAFGTFNGFERGISGDGSCEDTDEERDDCSEIAKLHFGNCSLL